MPVAMKLAIAALWLVLGCEHAARGDGIAQAIARGDAPETTSVLVMRGDQIAYERYFGGTTADTLHDTRSVGKSFTALAVAIAVDRGVLPGLAVPAFGYLGDLAPFAHAGAAKAEITVEDLLTMSSALDCDDNDGASPGNEENMYPQPAWTRWAVDLPVRADYRRDAIGRGPWHYCTAGVFLLGQVVQRAAHQPIDQFIVQRLFAPLGITRWEFGQSAAGEVMTGGGLRLRTRDLAAVARIMVAGGQRAGAQIVPAAFVREALTVHRETPFQQGYGYLFWSRTYLTPCGPRTGWLMSGNGGNAVVMFQDLDAVVVVTRTAYNTRSMHQQTARLIEDQILPGVPCTR